MNLKNIYMSGALKYGGFNQNPNRNLKNENSTTWKSMMIVAGRYLFHVFGYLFLSTFINPFHATDLF